jgi:hypothetical protein
VGDHKSPDPHSPLLFIRHPFPALIRIEQVDPKRYNRAVKAAPAPTYPARRKNGLSLPARSIRGEEDGSSKKVASMARWSGGTRFLLALASLSGIATTFSFLTFIDVPQGLRSHVYWLLWSQQYKRDVLSSAGQSTGPLHAEWEGDGWGGAPVGDWEAYVVYDPSDSLPTTNKSQQPRKISGIPCDVVVVRRLEKQWYSVVTGMNQFWDHMHPNC